MAMAMAMAMAVARAMGILAKCLETFWLRLNVPKAMRLKPLACGYGYGNRYGYGCGFGYDHGL